MLESRYVCDRCGEEEESGSYEWLECRYASTKSVVSFLCPSCSNRALDKPRSAYEVTWDAERGKWTPTMYAIKAGTLIRSAETGELFVLTST